MELKKNLNGKEMKEIKEIIDNAEDCLIVISEEKVALFGTKRELRAAFSCLVEHLNKMVSRDELEYAFKRGLGNSKEIPKEETLKELVDILERLDKLTKEM